ncbi:MAG: hypothetical protein KC444_06395 [Nitrosopumilus sp.]|nr:hypothetical protein [Nitrosopumilus sp.]
MLSRTRRGKNLIAIIAIIGSIAALTFAVSTFNSPQENTNGQNMITDNVDDTPSEPNQAKLDGLAYSGYRKNQSPLTGPHPSQDEMRNDLKLLSSITDRIRIYGIDGNNQFIPELAQEYGLKVAVTLLLTGDDTDYDKIEKAADIANKNNSIYTVIVENEGLYRETLTEDRIIQYVDLMRTKLNCSCTITVAEPIGNWFEHREIANHVDYVMIHYYPYFDGVKIEDAMTRTLDEYNNVKNSFGKDVVFGEIGWPSDGPDNGMAIPSSENQQKFILELRKMAELNETDYFLFEAFDEKWKLEQGFDTGGPISVESHWGIFYENGTMKEPLKNIMPQPASKSDRD